MTGKKTITITLDHPVEHDGVTYNSLTLRTMKAKDMVAADLVQGETRKGLAIFASMAGVPIQVLEELEADDFVKIGKEAAPMMGKRGNAMLLALEKLEQAGSLDLQ